MTGETTPPKSGGAGAAKKQPSAETLKKIAEMRTRLHSTIGQVVVALSMVPRYRHQTLADLQHLIVEPLMRDRLAIATAKPEAPAAASQSDGPGGVIGIAFWANVSDAVDAKIREQIKGGVFPVRLAPSEWASGETIWLLDVVAPSQRMASAVLANFSQLVKTHGPGAPATQKGIRIHPIVAAQVDPQLLKKMGATADGK